MKFLSALALTAALALPAQAEVDLGGLIADLGLNGTVQDLQARPDPTPSETFALAAAHFLRGIERNFQTRFRYDLSGGEIPVPGLSVGLRPNPAPEPFEPDVIARIFADLQADMTLARDTVPVGADAVVLLAPDSLWFDVNADGQRDTGESFLETAMSAVMSPRDIQALAGDPDKPGSGLSTIRFDSADTHWLLAYTHLLSGTAELVLAFDPSTTIERVLGAEQRLFADRRFQQPMFLNDETINLIAIVIGILETQPDPTRTQAAQAHFLDMMDANIAFWQAVELETDDNAEWIPNPRQTSALPVQVPAETGDQWQAVLAEARAILTGSLLIPHPRATRDANGMAVQGVNLGAWLQAPVPIDLVGYVHGYALEPFFEFGAVAEFTAVQQFQSLTGGNFGLFAIFLN